MIAQLQLFLSLLLVLLVCAWTDSSAEYGRICDSVFCRVLSKYNNEIGSLKQVIDQGQCIPQFGSKSDELCNKAIEEFSSEAALPEEAEETDESLFDKKVDELEKMLDAPLHVLYLKQLQLLREKALKYFQKQLNAAKEGTEYEAMSQADELFRKEAEEYTRQNPDWSYAKEASILKSSFHEITSRVRKTTEVKLRAAKQNQQAMQYLQGQMQQFQALQQQMMGAQVPWNIGATYRIPDSNFNFQFNYQQGKANLQVSCVPDESLSLLGPNGFVHGVTPGNVGLSFNLNI